VGEAVSDFRKRILSPSLIPVASFVFIGGLVFGFSRLLLAVPKDGSVVLGVLMAGSILFGAGALSKGGALKDTQRAALIAFGLLVIGGGVAAATSLHTRAVEGGAPAVAAELTAKNIKFDKRQIKVAADKPFSILFHNQDAGVLHNVSIYDTPATTKAYLRQPPFNGVANRIYALKNGLKKGVYFFRCDVHTTLMTGQLVVGNAPAPPIPGPTATGPAPAPSSPAPSASPTGGPTILSLIAKNTAFNTKTLTFPANQQIVIDFDNQDAGVPHNFSLYTDSTASHAIFQGQPFTTGPETRKYEFRAPGPGSYYFRCDVHPNQMFGTATVT
jgi:plastocyanin